MPKNQDGFVSDVRQGLQRDDRVVRDDRSHPDVVRDGGKLAAGRRWNDSSCEVTNTFLLFFSLFKQFSTFRTSTF